MTILHIDSSILGGHSISRDLTAGIVAFQKAAHPTLEVVYRDLAAAPVPHLSGALLAVWQGATPDNPDVAADVATGQAALAEFLAADIIVIGAPMYNFTIPSQLKAWIDRLVIAGTTFRYTATGVEGLVLGKKMIVASTRGGAYSEGTPAAFLDHQETYLRGVFGFLGVTDVTFIRAEGVAMGADQRAAAIAEAKTSITQLAA